MSIDEQKKTKVETVFYIVKYISQPIQQQPEDHNSKIQIISVSFYLLEKTQQEEVDRQISKEV